MEVCQCYMRKYGKHWYIKVRAPKGQWLALDGKWYSKEAALRAADEYGYEVVEHD